MRGISATTAALAFAAISFIIAGVSMLLPPKTQVSKTNVTQTTTTISLTVQTTTVPQTSTTAEVSTTTIQQTTTTQLPSNQTEGIATSTITSTTSTILAERENCCNDIDDDGDGLENGADPDCQQDVELQPGWNEVCWMTEVLNYENDRDYYSGWFKCPEGYVAEYVTVSFYESEDGIFLPLNEGDCLISYNKFNQTRRKICGYAEEQMNMNCTTGYIDFQTGEVSPVHICILETGNPRSNWVRLRFKSDSSGTATGVMVEGVYCAKEEEETLETAELEFWIEKNGEKMNETVIDLPVGTEIALHAVLSIDGQLYLYRNDGNRSVLIAEGFKEISIPELLTVLGTFNYTVYWPGNESISSIQKTIWVRVIEKEVKVNCTGELTLELNVNETTPGSLVSASIDGLENCEGYTAFLRESSCSGEEVCKCTVSGSGCSCSFLSPSEEGDHTYFACIDMNDNGVFEDNERVSTTLRVTSLSTCNPDGTNTTGLCDVNCNADPECEGRYPNSVTCEGDKKITCNSTCKYIEEDCTPYTCIDNECKYSCLSDDDCAVGYLCDPDDGKCKLCDMVTHKEVGGDSPNNKCEEVCGASPVCDELPTGTELDTCSFLNPNRKDKCNDVCQVEDSICNASCENYQGSVECSGRSPGSWCDGDIKKTCDENCMYSEVNCRDSNLYCINGRCSLGGGGGWGRR